jgi:DNA-directed RNA polymerase subunit beta
LAASRSAATSTTSTNALGPHRVSFARISEPLEVPGLLALQTDSFDWLLGNERWKERVDGAPKPVLEKVNKDSADKAKAALEGAGATVTVK